jgi:hypothetical protein
MISKSIKRGHIYYEPDKDRIIYIDYVIPLQSTIESHLFVIEVDTGFKKVSLLCGKEEFIDLGKL